MISAKTPSATMYAALKECGISNREAAGTLLNTALTFDGRQLRDRIDESSQLSRRIVHTRPGEIPAELFCDFTQTCPAIEHQILRRLGVSRRTRREADPSQRLRQRLLADYAPAMEDALSACDVDPSLYRNMVTYLEQADLPREEDRTLLHLMLFVVTGCLGDPQAAADLLVPYATDTLGADFHTAHTVTSANPYRAAKPVQLKLGIVRVVEGSIKAGSHIWTLDPAGTTIGLLAGSATDVTDVESDVSRQHARIWYEGGRWLLQDLGSTNGTHVISGASGLESKVGTDPAEAVEIAATDTICLGASTRFVVMPLLSS